MGKLERLDGKNLYYMFMAGASNIIDNQAEINRINVFPVADADTGTNMASTIRTVVDSLELNNSFKVTADAIGVAALTGARGNSGIIFAQFLYGFSEETADMPEVTVTEFAESLKRSVKYLYESVANPVEGTILTVIREWVEYIHEHRDRFDDFRTLMTESFEAARKSLSETTQKLAELAKANVVDAGAKGFVVFLEGMRDLILRRNIKKVVKLAGDTRLVTSHEEIPAERPMLRYCTEAMLEGDNINRGRLKEILLRYGDSVVVAGSSTKARIHVHTNDPAELFIELREHGRTTFQKVEDMVRQYQSAFERKFDIALVTDSTSDLPVEFIEKYQVHVVPINMEIDGYSYLDGLTLKHDEFYRQVDSTKSVPTTSQPAPRTFINLYSQLASRYKSVIALHISSGLSGTYNTSRAAAEKVSAELGTRIDVIDGLSISGAIGLMVKRAAEMIEEGIAHDDIVNYFTEKRTNARIFVSVKTLKYFVRSGRVSPVKGMIAQLLKVKPVVTMLDNGSSALIDKAFRYRVNRKKVIDNFVKTIEGKKLYGYSINHVMSPDEAQYFIDTLTELTGREPDFVSTVSPALGNHTGRGTVAVTLFTE